MWESRYKNGVKYLCFIVNGKEVVCRRSAVKLGSVATFWYRMVKIRNRHFPDLGDNGLFHIGHKELRLNNNLSNEYIVDYINKRIEGERWLIY